MKKLSLLLMVALLSVATWAQSNVILPLNRAIFSTTYGEKWLRLSCCDNTDYVWSATSSKEAKTACSTRARTASCSALWVMRPMVLPSITRRLAKPTS